MKWKNSRNQSMKRNNMLTVIGSMDARVFFITQRNLVLVISSLKLKSTMTSNWRRNVVARRRSLEKQSFTIMKRAFNMCRAIRNQTIVKPNMRTSNLLATESILRLSSMLRADSPANFCEAGIAKTNGLAPVWNSLPGITACWWVKNFSVLVALRSMERHWAAMESGVSNNKLKISQKNPLTISPSMASICLVFGFQLQRKKLSVVSVLFLFPTYHFWRCNCNIFFSWHVRSQLPLMSEAPVHPKNDLLSFGMEHFVDLHATTSQKI